MTKPILDCDLHDYLEIACIYKMQVHLTLADGKHSRGIPVTTKVNAKKEECLQFLPGFCKEQLSIPLYLLEKMEAIKPNPHFSTVTFIESDDSA